MAIADYEKHDGLGLAALVAGGEVTPLELLEEAIRRADDVNPQLNAIVYRWDDRARADIAAGLPAGPFRGVPFLLKDLGTPFTGQPISSGSRFFADTMPITTAPWSNAGGPPGWSRSVARLRPSSG